MDPSVAHLRTEINKRKPDRLVRRRQGVVQAVNYPAGTVDVQVGGSSVTVTSVAFVASYSPAVNDVVWILQDGTDLLVVGSQAPMPGWVGYTPAVTAATTNPTLGTGALVRCAYQRLGQSCWMRYFVQFGTSGTAAGSGVYFFSLPFTANAAAPFTIGNGWISHTNNELVSARLPGGGGTSNVFTLVYSGSAAFVSDATPWTWGAGDVVCDVNLMYQIADGF